MSQPTQEAKNPPSTILYLCVCVSSYTLLLLKSITEERREVIFQTFFASKKIETLRK